MKPRPYPTETPWQSLCRVLDDVVLHAEHWLDERELEEFLQFGASRFAKLLADRIDREERPS